MSLVRFARQLDDILRPYGQIDVFQLSGRTGSVIFTPPPAIAD